MPNLSFFSFCLYITLGDKTFGLVLCNSRTSVGTHQGKSQGLGLLTSKESLNLEQEGHQSYKNLGH
jgi:hypothetical protein